MPDGTGEKSVTIGRDANDNVIVTGDNNNIVFKIEKLIINGYSSEQLSEIVPYLKEFIESFLWKEDWQKRQAGKDTGQPQKSVNQQFPLASAYLWKALGPGQKGLNTTLHAVLESGGVVILKNLDIKLRIAQAEIAAQRRQSANTNSQTGAELMENLSKLAKEDQNEPSVNKLALNLSLPDMEAKRILQLEIDYQKVYRLKVEVRTLAGETIKVPASITLFQKGAPQLEVCQYTTRRGESVQIPEIEPGHYDLQIISKDTPPLLWKMGVELSSVTGRLM